ncbi:hypothetical protein P9222_20490 [Paenibacillus amylolyticus]|nr:hypothetical protein [Paenibacillus amylolyticus]WFR60909.1 hypothetical protein P9222_20490 [Paenibacillus amylolyticus]
MLRLFDIHDIRYSRELEGLWEFTTVTLIGERPDHFPYSLPVPGCWETHPHIGTYKGKAAYRKIVTTKQKANVRLEFKGISHTAHVYFDGTFVTSVITCSYTSIKLIQGPLGALLLQ